MKKVTFAAMFVSMLLSNIGTNAQIASYEGGFLNTDVNEGGVMTMTIAYLPNDSITGYINFTEHLGNQTLCGAGAYGGKKNVDSLNCSFISQDMDAGCGFDWGMNVIIAAKLTSNGDSIVGGYIFPTSTGIGYFNLKKKVATKVRDAVDGKLFSIVPNPSNGSFTIQLNGNQYKDAIVTITDVMGKVVKRLKYEPNKVLTIDEPYGIYFVTIQTGNFTQTEKLIINR